MTKNGVAIYSYPNPAIHSFCISLYIKAGCLYEPDQLNGITHFLEHVAFRNINRIMQGTLYQFIDQYGLDFNATTYKEFVWFSISGATKHFSKAADIITMVFSPIVLSYREIQLERQRIKSEIREEDIEKSLDYFTGNIVWKDTPLRNSITGKRRCLDKMGKETLCHVQREMYSSNLLFFYVTGCVDEGDISELKNHIEFFNLTQSPTVRDNTAPVPSQYHKRNDCIGVKNDSFTRICFSFDADVSKYTDAEISLLYDILLSGNACVVYQELSEKSGLIYSYDAALERYCNIGNLNFSFEVQSGTLERAVEIVINKLNLLKKGITSELEYVTAHYIDNALMLYDDAEELNWVFAYANHILNCGYRSINDRTDAYASVTADRLTKIANEIFIPENLVLTLKGNKKKLPIQRLQELVNGLKS